MSRKMYVHRVGKFEVRCPFESPDEAAKLFEAFNESAQIAIHKMDKKLGKSELQVGLPEIRGVGVEFNGEMMTTFGEGFSVTFLDREMLQKIADRTPGPEPEA